MCESLKKELEILKQTMARTKDYLSRMGKALGQAEGKADLETLQIADGIYADFVKTYSEQAILFAELIKRLKELNCAGFSFHRKKSVARRRKSKSVKTRRSKAKRAKAKRSKSGKAKRKAKPKRSKSAQRRRRYSY